MGGYRPRLLVRSALAQAAILTSIGTPTTARADGPEQVFQVPAPSGHTKWQITRPRVNQPSTDYPQITFKPGELVTVTGTGCVQTGGKGHTWKRWADPAGPNSDVLYHGQVSIPGATAGLVPVDVHQPAQYTIPAAAVLPANAHLTLGYTDNNYGDNGYSSRNSDDGNYSQCWKLIDAVVTVDIAQAPPPAPPPALSDYTFEVESVFIRSLRSRQNDTDVIGAQVVVDGTPSSVAQKKVGDWGRGGPHPAGFSVGLQQVTPDDRINVAYAIVNAGHGNENKVDDAVANVVESVASKVPVYGTIIAAVAEIWAALFNVVDANCDGPVFADNVTATGRQLADWTRNGAYRRTVSVPGSDSAVGCGGNSFYEVTYSIKRNASAVIGNLSGVRFPTSFAVNARSMQTTTSTTTKITRRRPLVNHR